MRHPTQLLLTSVLVGALCVALAAPSAQARTERSQEKSLVTLLQAFEFVPDRESLDRVGPSVNKLLVKIAGHPKYRPSLRNRALMALALYPSARTRDYLPSLFYDKTLSETRHGLLLRRQAIISFGKAFEDGAVDDLMPLGEDTDSQIREAWAHAMGETASMRALNALEAKIEHEDELHVRLAIDRAIAKLRGR